MKKNKTLTAFIRGIQTWLSIHSIEVVDYWDADNCAIGLQKNHKLIYISNYNFNDRFSMKYDYDLEIIDVSENERYRVVKEGRAVTEKELLDEIQFFFGVDFNSAESS